MKARFQYFVPLAFLVFMVALGATSLRHTDAAHAAKMLRVDTTLGQPAQIKMDEEVYDFKDIELGTIVEHTFIIHNTGGDTLNIIDAHPSCGCTAAIMDNKKIAPGALAHLKVKFDSNNKGEGPIVKLITITSNSHDQAEKVIRITGRIVKSKTAHKNMAMHLDGMFVGDCAKCHVDKGKGELGARLYDQDCAVCHGLKADGKPGPELSSDAMMKHTSKEWQKIIANGTPHTNMPGFALKNKGPLGDEEIASLVEYMGAFKKELTRSRTLKGTQSSTTPTTTTTTTMSSGATMAH
jgi:mono/diheme cytochrome c family protein